MDAKPDRALQLIALFKLVKGSLLVLLAFGAFHLLHRDVADALTHWARAVRIDPDNRYLAAVLAKANLVDDRKLKELGGLTLVYAGVFLTEGFGLLLQKRWAEYLTIVATGSLIPLEIYELCKHATVTKASLLVINVAVVVYLVVNLRRKGKADGKRPGRVREASPAR